MVAFIVLELLRKACGNRLQCQMSEGRLIGDHQDDMPGKMSRPFAGELRFNFGAPSIPVEVDVHVRLREYKSDSQTHHSIGQALHPVPRESNGRVVAHPVVVKPAASICLCSQQRIRARNAEANVGMQGIPAIYIIE